MISHFLTFFRFIRTGVQNYFFAPKDDIRKFLNNSEV